MLKKTITRIIAMGLASSLIICSGPLVEANEMKESYVFDGYTPLPAHELPDYDYILETTTAHEEYVKTDYEIALEEMYGQMEMLAQLVEAEAGDQGLTGMRYVVDVVLNRVDSDKFPNTIEEVIFQKYQFSPILNGAYERAGNHISDDAYKAVELEWFGERLDSGILYFSSTARPINGKNAWKYRDHWLSY
jgi:spore germination cell wall hydrolase CwlJ-like protein